MGLVCMKLVCHEGTQDTLSNTLVTLSHGRRLSEEHVDPRSILHHLPWCKIPALWGPVAAAVAVSELYHLGVGVCLHNRNRARSMLWLRYPVSQDMSAPETAGQPFSEMESFTGFRSWNIQPMFSILVTKRD